MTWRLFLRQVRKSESIVKTRAPRFSSAMRTRQASAKLIGTSRFVERLEMAARPVVVLIASAQHRDQRAAIDENGFGHSP